jgi:hypothetical protein
MHDSCKTELTEVVCMFQVADGWWLFPLQELHADVLCRLPTAMRDAQ